MKSLLIFAVVLFSLQLSSAALTVTRYVGLAANTWLVSDHNSTVIIDAGFNDVDASGIAALANSMNKTVTSIFITHPHPDHFGGLPYLHVAFPGVPAYVANTMIAQATVGAAILFSGSANFTVMPLVNTSTIPGLSVDLMVNADFKPAESDVTSIVYEPSQQIVFTGDLVYNRQFLFLGGTVNADKLNNWIDILDQFDSTYSGWTMYPGHGEATPNITQVIREDRKYLIDWMHNLCDVANITVELKGRMMAAYPTWGNSLLLDFSIANPEWMVYKQSKCLQVTVYNGTASNAFLVHDPTGIVIIDSGFSDMDGEAIYNKSLQIGKTVYAIYLTHPHPDHFGGLWSLHQRLPAVPIYVASAEIAGFTKLVAMNSPVNPLIASLNFTLVPIINGTKQLNVLPGGVSLSVFSDIPPHESDVSSFVASTTNFIGFIGDTIYNRAHMFLGPTVNATKVAVWKNLLMGIKSSLADMTIYPGHGAAPIVDVPTVIQENIDYLDFFMASLCNGTQPVNLTVTLVATLTARYPTWTGANVIAFAITNPEWTAYQLATCPGAAPGTTIVATNNNGTSNSTAIRTTVRTSTPAGTTKAPNSMASVISIASAVSVLLFFMLIL
jgi:glyoxylase-like metal-dependent hydrolase (beta-lactamase superfamily II)